MPDPNPYEELHATLVAAHSECEALLTAKSEALEAVQQSKFPATQLPKIMAALQHQHEWELQVTVALQKIIDVVGVAVDEEETNGAPS